MTDLGLQSPDINVECHSKTCRLELPNESRELENATDGWQGA